jgi:asparagine synthase (glutamine-hydrolysing)
MCGIAGLLKPRPSDDPGTDRAIVLAMRDRMTHRGPDDAGAWHDERCFLGHRRLSIIDLSPAGRQPMTNEDGDVVIVFNGEIYNHADLRRELEPRGHRYRSSSDTESIVHGYEEWGLGVCDRMNGMFAMAIWDRRDRAAPVMHLVRDRIGIKPLYLSRTGTGEWLFASEIKALLAHPAVSAEVDLTALWHYLTFIVAPAPLTLFRGIFKIPAGWRVRIDASGRATSEQWWDCPPDRALVRDPATFGEEECAQELLAKLRTSIARRMVSDVPFGVLLSGGVDSSLNVALMSELMDRPVTTFSIGYRGHDRYNEFDQARRVAARFGTDHHEVQIDERQMREALPRIIEFQDEPIADNVCIPLYFLAETVKRAGTTVVQVGEGADENWLGYWWCEEYRRQYEDFYAPIRGGRGDGRRGGDGSWWSRMRARALGGVATAPPARSAADEEAARRAAAGQELFWGGAACWWGRLRDQLTPDPAPFRQEISCPVEGLLPDALRTLDSHAVVRSYLAPLDGRIPEPEILHKIPYMELKLRLPEHLLMRVDKFTMAHAVEARVPFLDHELVDLARRVPPSYKLRDGIGKHVLKRAARGLLERSIVDRRKQGFGAPMEEWFRSGDFREWCVDAFERSPITRERLVDAGYVRDLFRAQTDSGGWSFHLWTIMNVVLWLDLWG